MLTIDATAIKFSILSKALSYGSIPKSITNFWKFFRNKVDIISTENVKNKAINEYNSTFKAFFLIFLVSLSIFTLSYNPVTLSTVFVTKENIFLIIPCFFVNFFITHLFFLLVRDVFCDLFTDVSSEFVLVSRHSFSFSSSAFFTSQDLDRSSILQNSSISGFSSSGIRTVIVDIVLQFNFLLYKVFRCKTSVYNRFFNNQYQQI